MSQALGESRIPGTLNLTIGAVVVVSAAALLWVASHTASWVVMILAAIVFSFVANTSYSLMHEAVHKHFHPNATINEWAGRILAGLFPTAFALQRVFHLAHHRNNRTEHERFDYYGPDDNKLLKFAQWYCILTGLYWVISPLACIAYFLFADFIRWKAIFQDKGGWFARQTSAQEFLEALETVPVWRGRMDILVSLAVQALLVWGLGLTLGGWAICYAAFAVNWSSLQYTDHAFSDLDRHEGAWNLKVGPLSRLVFLNYHYHLVHHRDPSISWIDLPGNARTSDPSPSFWSIYLQMWRGPRPLPASDDHPR